jgi:predicted nucleic acid-binding protein
LGLCGHAESIDDPRHGRGPVYAHDGGAGKKHEKSVELLTRLVETDQGAASTEVLAEFYVGATWKLGMTAQEAEEVLVDLGSWNLHRPSHDDLLHAARLLRRHKISWWDALIVQSALAMGCSILWTEDLSHGRHYGSLTARKPFA